MTHIEARVLVPSPPWRRGVLKLSMGGVPCALAFEIVEQRGGIAELALGFEAGERRAGGEGADSGEPSSASESVDPKQVGDPRKCSLVMLAEAGFPVLGDSPRAGARLKGGPRWLYSGASWSAGSGAPAWWPEEEVFPRIEGRGGRLPELAVSRVTQRVLARGHPWILRDAETGDCAGLLPGTLVQVVGPKGKRLGLARVEGAGSLAARMWTQGGGADTKPESVEARVARALKRRRALLVPPRGEPRSDAYRLVHGEADGLPGIVVDRLGSVLRVLVSGRGWDAVRPRVLAALVGGLSAQLGPNPPVVEVLHLRHPPGGELERVRLAQGSLHARSPGAGVPDGDGRIVVHELGLAYLVDPGLQTPTRSTPGFGLFFDQRENRRRLMEHAGRGGRWLNLFAHTGAFSVALLAAGATRVTSVDLSAAYLRWLEENLALNGKRGVEARNHRSVRGDGRRFLARLAPHERFEGIILDPPTAASAGRNFWSVARDLRPLVEGALAHLHPGGVLLVSRNDRRGKQRIEEVVESAARSAGVAIEMLGDAPAGSDFPRLEGFEEGEPFKALLVRRRA
jgi:23S rRNA (cytosine1962-C5)-methyltransferase